MMNEEWPPDQNDTTDPSLTPSAPSTESPSVDAESIDQSAEGSQEVRFRPQFGVGSRVVHPSFGVGRVQSYEGNSYVILFRGGDIKLVSFAFQGMHLEEASGDPELDRIRVVMEEVLSDYGWIDAGIELGARWQGGQVVLEPGKSDTQAKEIPMEMFFKKIIGIREKLRVLEQKINNHKSLDEAEKLELEGYITRCYGSLTTFNVLFANKELGFKGSGK